MFVKSVVQAIKAAVNVNVVIEQRFNFITAQCTLVHLRGLGIACRLSVCPSVCPSVCNVGDL